VLILDSDTTSRLELAAALRDCFQLLPHDDTQPAVRRVRSEQPALVLVVLGKRKAPQTLRTVRVLKTDARPPAVAVIDPWGRTDEDDLEVCDGVWTGIPDAGLVPWCQAVLAGQNPREVRPLRRGLLRRLFT
jgi:hypothetical protein